MRIGIYGGSFNPVHNGHIHLALTAAEEFGLDRIYLVPSKKSPHRSSDEYAPDADRVEMLRLACRISDKLEVSSYELENDRVSYSVYTVRHFREFFPDAELFLLVGSDMLLSFDKWFCYKEILSEAILCVVSRNRGDLDELRRYAGKLGESGRILISSQEPVEASSTEIRKKIAKNENFSCYLDKNVVQYITMRGLYSFRGENKLHYDPDEKKKYLKEHLSAKRYNHSLNVAAECRKLALKYNEDPDKAYFAGLVHDICKELPDNELKTFVDKCSFTVCREELETRSLWHAIAGASFIKNEFGVEDIDILNSVRFHTVGRAGMSRLEEIVYLGDLISADRDYKDVDRMRKLSYISLNEAMLEAFSYSIKSVVKKGGLVPLCTAEGYNFYTRLHREERSSNLKRGLK
ncbi:MAG: nicotinate (nicotinamide) nucleotide adenylyltransferase [Ruminococcus sp.]|nr:nicotinate (nicotinamide) nucleotide adenylyltransferase [Ruminococcus sp.]